MLPCGTPCVMARQSDNSPFYQYYPEDKKTLIFNYFILLGKRHIFTQRFEQKTPNIDLFFDFVKGKLIVHKCVCCGSILSLVQIFFPFVFGYGNA